MPRAPIDPDRLLSSLAQRRVALELQTLDLCFLAALHLRAERASLSSFSEEQLVDVFEQTCAAVDGVAAAGELRRRSAPAIRRLREQRMLTRVDGAGVLRAGDYALTRLAIGILEFFLEEETLTRESLTVLTATLRANLAGIVAAARVATSADDWRSGVVAPLRVTITDLMSGIQRRQRGFDVQQEDFQREIAELLRADWFGAVDRCRVLLESTSETLRELNQILLRDAHELHGALEELQELAATGPEPQAEEATRSVVDQVDRIAAWGANRQRAWSEYYRYVHRFLRDVVRLDPTRVLTHRLRERLAGQSGRPFALTVAATPPIRLLRPVTPPPGDRPAVRRRRLEKEIPLADEPVDDAQARLETDVRGAFASGARGLRDVTAQLAGSLAGPERFVAAGRIAQAVARVSHPEGRAERPWVAVEGDLVIEEWTVLEGAP